MNTVDGWLGYAHSRYSEGDYYLCVRVTKSEKELIQEYIDAHIVNGFVYLPSGILHSLAMKEIRRWKHDSSKQTVIGEVEE